MSEKSAVDLIKDDLQRDIDAAIRDLETVQGVDSVVADALEAYIKECRALISRTDWTAKQFIKNKIL